VPATFDKVDDTLEIDLSSCARGSDFEDTLEKVKELAARRFDFDRKIWITPAEPDIAERLMKGAGATSTQEVYDWVAEAGREQQQELATQLPEDVEGLYVPWAYRRADWQPEEVNDEKVVGLLDFQRVAVDHMAREQRAILGDDMGLGKTLIALSAVEEYRLRNGQVDGPKLVVCPASVKGSWLREIKRWLPPETPVVLVDGKTPAKRTKQIEEGIVENAWIIVNWEQLRVKKVTQERIVKRRDGSTNKRKETIKVPKEPLFGSTEWLAVVCDEAHKAKNRKSQQTQGLWLLQQTKLAFALTGTAIQNSPDELWPILAWLWPAEYHERGNSHRPGAMAYWSFYTTFVDFYEAWGRKIIIGVKNADALRFRLNGRLIRRTAEILGLKGRKRVYYPVDLLPEQQKAYDEVTTQMWVEIEAAAAKGDKDAQKLLDAPENVYRIPNGAARTVRQRQVIESLALLGGEDISANLDDCVEKIMNSRPNPWVVFVEFKMTCDLLKARLEKHGLTVGIYNGDVSPEDRTALEDAYQRGEVDVVVGTIGAMREGITLTRGHHQDWISRAWVPDWNEQGESRQDRKGQQNQVIVHIPLATNTVADGTIQVTNRRKERIVRAVLPKHAIAEETA
jgi:SNF2 family DNA or RNA helicase